MSNPPLQAGSDGEGKDQADQFLLLGLTDPHPPPGANGATACQQHLAEFGLRRCKSQT